MTRFGPLVDVDYVRDHLADDSLRIADCRWYLADPAAGRRNYAAGHIPGAIFVSVDDDLSDPPGNGRHPLPRPDRFLAGLGRLGIGPTTRVVAYDDRGGAIAARLWWMLTELGHSEVAVLDGGIDAWVSAGGRLESASPVYPAVSWFSERRFSDLDRDSVAEEIGTVVLIDARAAPRYRGEHEPIDPVAGHIPSAVNVPYEENLTHDGRLRPPDELRDRYVSAGVVDGAGTVVYCGSGVNACHSILAMEVAGLGRAALYSGSWSDWATAGFPAVTGGDPGSGSRPE